MTTTCLFEARRATLLPLTADLRPAEATYHFAANLERPLYRWLEWSDGAYVPFELPAMGETVLLPAATAGP